MRGGLVDDVIVIDFVRRFLSYEDIVQKYHPLPRHANEVVDEGTGRGQFFNRYDMIATKVDYALKAGIGGMMIWELGSDCRTGEVTHFDRPSERHVVTCPSEGPGALLNAVTERVDAFVQEEGIARAASSQGGAKAEL